MTVINVTFKLSADKKYCNNCPYCVGNWCFIFRERLKGGIIKLLRHQKCINATIKE
jgi:hypothetical protein